MSRVFALLLLLAIAAVPLSAQAPARGSAPGTADSTFYSVAYIEVKPSGRAAATQALKQYKDALRINNASSSGSLLIRASRP